MNRVPTFEKFIEDAMNFIKKKPSKPRITYFSS